MSTKPFFASTIALLCGVALFGCTPAEPDATIALPEKNIDQWVMPLDQFLLKGIAQNTYAELVLIEPCMHSAGLPFALPPWEERQGSESFNAAMIRLNNEGLSAKWGYHLAPATPAKYAAQWTALDTSLTALSESDYAIFEGCRETAREELPLVTDIHNYASSLKVQAADEAVETDEVKAASSAWVDCMATIGIADLPTSPEHMPAESQVASFKLLDAESPVTQEERDAAVADSACRRSSGYLEALYSAQWDAEAALLNENADTVFRFRTELDEHYAKIAEIINGYVSTS